MTSCLVGLGIIYGYQDNLMEFKHEYLYISSRKQESPPDSVTFKMSLITSNNIICNRYFDENIVWHRHMLLLFSRKLKNAGYLSITADN